MIYERGEMNDKMSSRTELQLQKFEVSFKPIPNRTQHRESIDEDIKS